jgi:protein involved in polysaccharide export with SLBB domain
VASSTSQGTNVSTQRQLTQANVGTINELEKLMQHLFDDGKSLYERSDKTRLKDYTYKQLLKLVRREQQQEKDVPGK